MQAKETYKHICILSSAWLSFKFFKKAFLQMNKNIPTYRQGWITKAGKKKQGFWRIRHNGRYVSLTKFGSPATNKNKADRASAMAAAAKFLNQSPTEIKDDRLTVGDVIGVYQVKHLVTLPKATQGNFSGIIDHFLNGIAADNKSGLKPFKGVGSMPFDQLTIDHIDTFCDCHKWEAGGLANGLKILRASMNYATKQVGGKIITDHPLKGCTIENPAGRTETFSPEPIKLILENSSPEFGLIFQALLETGARPSELCKLTANHVKIKSGLLYWQLNSTEWKCGKRSGKIRVICPTQKWQDHSETIESGHLFLNSSGTPWNANSISRYFLRLKERLNLNSDLVVYCARHTFITRALKKGLSIKLVADYCGTSARQIEKTYSHLLVEIETLNQVAVIANSEEKVTV